MPPDVQQLIANVLFFKGLSKEELEDIRRISSDHRYDRNQIIFSDGEEGRGFFLVVEGAVKVFKVSPDGKEKILHILGPGEPVGQVAVFAGLSFPASAQALRSSRLLFFPRKAFVDLIHRKPSLAMNMLAILSNRLREFTLQIEGLSLKEVPARLAAYLLYLAEEQGREDLIDLTITKAQLASIIGTIPETLSRIFNRMAQAGMIRVDGRAIHLLDPDAIVDLSENGKLQ
ncbi:MAG: Crp/Fnr family transcriptional regulator [Desulfobacterales bacterium]